MPLCVTQEKITIKLCKRLGEGAVFSYEDAAKDRSLFSTGFSLWISLTGSYSTYGSLATVAVVMVWLYYCITILLWGGCINKALEPLWN